MMLDHSELKTFIQTVDSQRKSHRHVLIGLEELFKEERRRKKIKGKK